MRPSKLPRLLLLALTVPVAGCNVLGAAAYYLGPRHMEKAQFKLTQGRVALVIDNARPSQQEPVFDQALHDKLVQVFRERNLKSQVVPYHELNELRRSNPDFASWSLQRIGGELEAEQVLYLRIEQLVLRESPQAPVLNPSVTLRVKVIGTNQATADARLWPKQTEDYGISCTRPPQDATDPEAVDSAAAKLGREAAQQVARLFYDVDLEELAPRED